MTGANLLPLVVPVDAGSSGRKGGLVALNDQAPKTPPRSILGSKALSFSRASIFLSLRIVAHSFPNKEAVGPERQRNISFLSGSVTYSRGISPL